MKKKFIAFALSAVCVAAECVADMPSIRAEEADSNEWIPQNFNEAIDFYNKYGATHIEGNIVCYVRRTYIYSGETYRLEFTENSDVTEYLSQNNYEYVPDDGYSGTDFSMEVDTFEMPENSALEIFTYADNSSGARRYETTYSFSADENGEISETDLFGWVPDCVAEYEEYIEANGNISVHCNNIVYCNDINYSTGSEIIFEQLGTAEVREIYNGSAGRLDIYPPPPGYTSRKVIVYEAVTAGTVKLNWKIGRPWDMSHIDDENTNYFAVDENMTVTETEEKNFTERVRGDVNGDGRFSSADVVALQKWLLALPDAELTDWKAADLCEDDRLDVFDLCVMKGELLKTDTGDNNN